MSGQEGDRQPPVEKSFVEQIQENERLRMRLAIQRASGVFYSGLDLGDPFDVSLKRALGIAITDKDYLDEIAETGTVPEGGTYERNGLEAIARMEAGEQQQTFEPNPFRKKMASWILRQEVRTKRHVINVSLRRMKLAHTVNINESEV